ncbi:MAG TPA: signal peptidase II [Candidatus Nanoarchaeia archaeon]|nr:signal peptidase II [Candidatus Nanoarchaeia archaeon]
MVRKLFLIALGVVILDHITKALARRFLDITKNYGAAFGLFQGGRIFFILAAVVVMLLVWHYRKEMNWLGAGLLLGGTIGNLIDRVIRGYVIDFINLGWWPSFNIADSANVIGVAIILITEFRKKK